MTLFFLQLFQTVTTNWQRHRRPFGILSIDPVQLVRAQARGRASSVFSVSYLYVALAFFAVVFVALHAQQLTHRPRVALAAEDPLAAEAMGMPVNWLKLMAFSFGASVAALTGTCS